MEPFNRLKPSEAERLALLLEELGEAQQAIGKILRHGYESYHPDNPHMSNRQNLEKELGHVMHAVELLVENDLSVIAIHQLQARKKENVKQYLHHQ